MQKEEVIYEPYVPKGYYYRVLRFIGSDNNGNIYFVRIVKPDIEDVNESKIKEEVWADVINLGEGNISSIKLEPDVMLCGPYATKNTYKVDAHGNIYQMQVDTNSVRILKYISKK